MANKRRAALRGVVGLGKCVWKDWQWDPTCPKSSGVCRSLSIVVSFLKRFKLCP
jgi:hypothetical protein